MFQLFNRYDNEIDFSINLLTLAFREKDLEEKFNRSYFESNLQVGRACHLIAIFFYVVVGLWDAIVIDPSRFNAWICVIITITCIFLFGLAFSYKKKECYAKYWQQIFSFYVFATGTGFTTISILCRRNFPIYNFVGIIFCLFFCYAFIRLTFLWASAAGNTIVMLYALCAALFVDIPFKQQAIAIFYMFGISLLGMMVCYSLELMSRRDFVLNELLSQAEKKAADLNMNLEQKIKERTKELNVAHQREKELHIKLNQVQKMESIGVLAGGIAHDFNNILSSILGFTDLALDDVQRLVSADNEKISAIEDCLQEVNIAGNRAKELVNQILTFARQSEEEVRPVRIDKIAGEVIKFIRSSIPTTIKIKKNISSSSLVMGNQTQIHQILMNLCTNAAHAMKENGGSLTVNLADVVIDDTFDNRKRGLKAGDYIALSVSDTGNGISPDIIGSIFDPYFTTKEVGEGTGMGLATVHGIVESYNGKITVKSRMDEGTIFTIYLPVTHKRKLKTQNESREWPTGTEKILFVDDEASIAKMGGKTLEALGYTLTTRTSSVEALELFRSRSADFDLVITDMTMPYITGDVLAAEMMILRPDIPVILCTGYSNKLSNDTVSEIGIKALIQKPATISQMAKTVRKVLDERNDSKA